MFCHMTTENDPGQNDVLLDLRLPNSPEIAGASQMVLTMGQTQATGIAFVDAFDEVPIVVAGHQITARVVTRLPARVWSGVCAHRHPH